MHGEMPGLLSVAILSLVHLYANKTKVLGWLWRGRFLSFAAGLSFAYVFVDLLPAIDEGQPVLKQTFGDIIPYFDKHAYLIALFGLLFYYMLQRKIDTLPREKFWLSISGYVLFNFFVGASLSDPTNLDIQPIALFTIAIAMHYFVRDHQARQTSKPLYMERGRWLLVSALIIGFVIGKVTHIPNALVAIAVSFLAGGILLNVLHYELPSKKQSGMSFVIGAVFYTALLIFVGKV